MLDITPDDTVISLLRHWSVTLPNTPAFIYVSENGQREVFTRQLLYSLSRRSASWLKARGVKQGDVVACLLPFCPEQLLVVTGLTVLGAIPLCVDIFLQDGSEAVTWMNRGDVTALVVDSRDVYSLSALRKHITDMPSEDGAVSCQAAPSLRTLIYCRTTSSGSQPSFLSSVQKESELEPCQCRPDDVVVIWPTSGTTGVSKLVPRTHRQVLKIGQQICECFGYKPGDVIYNASSFTWISGYLGDYLAGGVTRVGPYQKETAPKDATVALWDVLCKEQPVAGFIKPLQLTPLRERLQELQARGTWKADVLTFGGFPTRGDVCQLLGTLTRDVRIVYGSTESGFNAYKSFTEASQGEDFNCGRPLAGQELKIVDENQQEVDVNTHGRLWVKNDVIFPGYLKQPQESRAVLTSDGWYVSGDVAWRNAEGDYFVQGRTADIVQILGRALYPEMLEARLSDHPAVQEVTVVGIPDPETLNRPCVCVRHKDTPDAQKVSAEEFLEVFAEMFNQKFQNDKVIQAFVPKWCLFFADFPKNRNGKLKRKELRALAMKRLNISE